MTRRKEHEMTPRKRNIPFLIVLALTAGALIIPSAQAGGPDDRPLYRGTWPAAVPGSMSQDDRSFNRGTPQSSTSVSTSPDDRSYYRGGTAGLSVAKVPSSSITPDDRSFTRHAVGATSSPVAVSIPSDSFDWYDAVVGGAFAMVLALLGLGALLIAQRRRTLRPA
jgi:hypothetical protein